MKVCDVVLNTIWHDPRVRKQIISYTQAGVDTVCVGVMDNRHNEQAIKALPCPVLLAPNVKENKGRGPRLLQRIKTLSNLLKEIRLVRDLIMQTRPDIIHANDLDALVPSYMAAKKLGCKLIYDTHEICLENNYIHNNRLLKLFYAHYERKIIRQVNTVVCVSHAAADYLARFYDIPLPTVVTNCCIQAEQRLDESKHPGFEVLNHGGFYDGRGYDIMVEAAPLLRDHPEVRLALRGFGYLEEQLHSRAEELSATNVTFYPRVRVDELITYASRSMVGIAITENICLNFELSVSNKLFEYAAAGLPVIMSDIPEHRLLNEKYDFGIVLPDNTPQSLAQAIIRLYTDKELYHTCRQNAIHLSNEVNWEREFQKLLDIEKGLMHSN